MAASHQLTPGMTEECRRIHSQSESIVERGLDSDIDRVYITVANIIIIIIIIIIVVVTIL